MILLPASTVNTSSKPWNCQTSKSMSLRTLAPTKRQTTKLSS